MVGYVHICEFQENNVETTGAKPSEAKWNFFALLRGERTAGIKARYGLHTALPPRTQNKSQ